jgi:hypothetical protein
MFPFLEQPVARARETTAGSGASPAKRRRAFSAMRETSLA